MWRTGVPLARTTSFWLSTSCVLATTHVILHQHNSLVCILITLLAYHNLGKGHDSSHTQLCCAMTSVQPHHTTPHLPWLCTDNGLVISNLMFSRPAAVSACLPYFRNLHSIKYQPLHCILTLESQLPCTFTRKQNTSKLYGKNGVDKETIQRPIRILDALDRRQIPRLVRRE